MWLEALFSRAGVAEKGGFGPTPHRTQGWKTRGVQVQYFGFCNGFPLNNNAVLKPSKEKNVKKKNVKKKCAFWGMNYFGNLKRPQAHFLSLSATAGTQGVGKGWGWKKASGASGAVLYHSSGTRVIQWSSEAISVTLHVKSTGDYCFSPSYVVKSHANIAAEIAVHRTFSSTWMLCTLLSNRSWIFNSGRFQESI